MTDSPRTFLPSLPDDWTYAVVIETASDDTITINQSPDGWDVAYRLDRAVTDETYSTLREALLGATTYLRKMLAARARLDEAARAYAELVGLDPTQPQTAGFADVQKMMNAKAKALRENRDTVDTILPDTSDPGA